MISAVGFQGGFAHLAGAGAETFGDDLGAYPWQIEVDFGLLGPRFHVMVGGGTGDGGCHGTCRVRIGGTYDTIDGTIALEQVMSVSAYHNFVAQALVRNGWSGIQPVKLTGAGGFFALGPTLVLVPG